MKSIQDDANEGFLVLGSMGNHLAVAILGHIFNNDGIVRFSLLGPATSKPFLTIGEWARWELVVAVLSDIVSERETSGIVTSQQLVALGISQWRDAMCQRKKPEARLLIWQNVAKIAQERAVCAHQGGASYFFASDLMSHVVELSTRRLQQITFLLHAG
jgi:hypothetical protein